MDCDLQDPPEVIPKLLAAAQNGAAIVYAKRQAGEPRLRKFANRMYFFLLDKLVGHKVDPEQGSFSLIARRVIDAYLRFEERERHYLFILRWLGFDSVAITYARDKRAYGESSYTLQKLVRHALEGIFFQSTRFLIWILWVGLATSAASLVAVFFLILSAITGSPPQGWTSLIIVQLATSGVILAALGGTGLYIARIFESSKRRPLYIFDPGPPLETKPLDL
jgi:dolichol-phosphate mannosyltransferase